MAPVIVGIDEQGRRYEVDATSLHGRDLLASQIVERIRSFLDGSFNLSERRRHIRRFAKDLADMIR